MTISERREFLFLYDVRDANPNGDPDDGNRPRMDKDGYNIVTDVRLKRTIRDYWLKSYQGQSGKEVLIRRELHPKEGDLLTLENLVLKALNIDSKKLKEKAYRKDAILKIANDLLKIFIDVRTFGAAITVTNANYSHTGPVQFAIGRSLNRPNVMNYTITTTLPSGEGKGAGTFGEFHGVDYSLIRFHGIACEYTAEQTGFCEDDLQLLYEGLWNGTKMLNTRSKFNHLPRLILTVVSKEKSFQIGDLDRKISMNEKDNIKDVSQVKLDITPLINSLKDYSDNIEKVEVLSDGVITYIADGKESNDVKGLLESTGINIESITLKQRG